jgi:hypothetical protein
MNTNIHLWSYLAQFFLEWKMFQTKVIEKIKTPILCSITLFFENRAVYEITWKNTVQPDRPQMTIWRMRITCWITKATNTHSDYVILIAFPRQQCYVIRALPVLFRYFLCWLKRRPFNSGNRKSAGERSGQYSGYGTNGVCFWREASGRRPCTKNDVSCRCP